MIGNQKGGDNDSARCKLCVLTSFCLAKLKSGDFRYHRWPDDALEAVAMKFLKQIDDLDEKTIGKIVKMCKMFHQVLTGSC